jgi:hypothetical protein
MCDISLHINFTFFSGQLVTIKTPLPPYHPRGVLGPDEANGLKSEALQEILELAARPRDGFGYRLLPIEALLDIEKSMER